MDIVIVGAGFAGLYRLHKAHELGLRAEAIERRAPGVVLGRPGRADEENALVLQLRRERGEQRPRTVGIEEQRFKGLCQCTRRIGVVDESTAHRLDHFRNRRDRL